jgi:hypothetical protein
MKSIKDNPEFHFHIYDIVISNLYAKIIIQKNVSTKYISTFLDLIHAFHESENVSELEMRNMPGMIVSSKSNYYSMFLSYALASLDIYEIKLFLNYHNQKFEENTNEEFKNNFVGLLEFFSLKQVRSLSLYKTLTRLERITDWISEHRESGNLTYSNIIKIDHEFYYWVYDSVKLDIFYKYLVSEGLIEENHDFKKVFLTFKCDKNKRVKWKSNQTILVFIFYLIYKSDYFNGDSIFIILTRLFVKQDGSEFEPHVLRTTYNNISQYLNTDDLLPHKFSKLKSFLKNHILTKP